MNSNDFEKFKQSKPQLCYVGSLKDLDDYDGYLVSEKYDGVYCRAVLVERQVHILSRTGKEYTSLSHLKPPLKEILNFLPASCFIIFEAYIPNTPFNIISGHCRDTKNQHPDVIAIIHDVVNSDELDVPYRFRYKTLVYLQADIHNKSIRFIKNIAGNPNVIRDFAFRVWNNGGEGLVLRNPMSPYSPGKRNKDMVKLKQNVTFDLKVVDVFEGKGKYKDNLGGLICEDSQGVQVCVGSGLTDDQRVTWWKDTSLIIGLIVEVKAMKVSAKGSLREPRFITVRRDKTEVDKICT